MSMALKFLLASILMSLVMASRSHRYFIDHVLRTDLHLARNQLIGLSVELSEKVILYDAHPGDLLRGNA